MDLSYALDYPVIAGTSPVTLHLLVRLETWPEEGGTERKPLNLALAIDRSGSMGGEKLRATQEAAIALLERLSPRDVLSLVTFETEVEVLIPPTPVSDLDYFRRRIRAIHVGANTNLSGGWLRALGLLAARRGPDFLSRVLLLTDGQANQGVTDRESLRGIAAQHAADGVVTTTLGFGADFNEGDLTAIAEAGAGHFYFIDTPEQAATTFLQEFGELTRVFGQNCEMTLTPAPGMPAPLVLGTLPRTADGPAQRVSFGDVRERDLKQLVAAFALSPGLGAGVQELASVQVAYDAVRGKVGHRQHVLAVQVRVDPAQALGAPAPEVEREVTLEQVAALKRDALDRLQRGQHREARGKLEEAEALLLRRRVLDPPAFDREVENLRGLLREATDRHSFTRKTLASQTHEFVAKSGAYTSVPLADLDSFSLTPGTPEVVDDISDHLRLALARAAYPERLADALDYALRELVANALEHGCKGAAAPRIEVDLRIGRNYAKVVVRDNGVGFDFAGVLARAEREAGAAAAAGESGAGSGAGAAPRRGRGLLLVQRRVDTLVANAAGNELTAAIRRQAARFACRADTLIVAEGVGQVAVLEVQGHLDASSYGELDRQLRAALANRIFRLVVDLTGCGYLSSAGLGALIGAATAAQEEGGGLAIVSPSPRVRDVFAATGVQRLFLFAETVDAAKRLFETGGEGE